MKKALAIACLIGSSKLANAWSLFGNYDDCVLEGIKTAQNTAAVAAVKEACRRKHPNSAPSRSLPSKRSFNLPPNCINASISTEEADKIKLQPEEYGYSVWNGNDFVIYDLAFRVKHNSIQPLTGRNISGEINKSVGFQVNGNSSENVIGFPEGIYSYVIISATKKVCR